MSWRDYDNYQENRKGAAEEDFCNAAGCNEDGAVFCDGCGERTCMKHAHDNAAHTLCYCEDCKLEAQIASVALIDDAAVARYAEVA